MKVALIFLVCFVSLSYQYVWMPYPLPQELFYPRYYHQSPSYAYNPVLRDEDVEVQGRIPAGGFGSQKSRPGAEQRLFWNNNWNLLLASFLPRSTSSTTVFVTVTSTTTTASVMSCISSGLFVANGGTNVCSRRRRDVMTELIEDISPSEVKLVEVTELPEAVSQREEPEIASSLSVAHHNEEDSNLVETAYRQGRSILVVATSTSTITQFSFSSTAIKKFFTMAAANGLSCLPVGYTVC